MTVFCLSDGAFPSLVAEGTALCCKKEACMCGMSGLLGLMCTVPLSLFADPGRILRRLYVFAEEPCKSTITTSEPCSPVFKEAQQRPSKQSISLISRIRTFMNFIIVHNAFLLLVIYCCNKTSNRIVTRSKELVLYFWIPLSPEVSRLSPYTHAQQHTRPLRTFYTFALITPSLVENPMSCGRRGSKNSGSSVADCVHTAIFQNIHENRVPFNCELNPERSPHTWMSDLHLQQKENR